jgi:hypothetical protein
MSFPIQFFDQPRTYRGFTIEEVGGTYFAVDDAYEAEFVEGMWRQCGGVRFTDDSIKGIQDQIDDHWSEKTCQVCEGSGRVSFDNPIKTETGTFSERLSTSCDSCEGKGTV